MSGLAEVARYNSRVDADLVRLLLLDGGIDALLFDTEVNSFYGGLFIPVRLMVPEEQLETAIDLLLEGGML